VTSEAKQRQSVESGHGQLLADRSTRIAKLGTIHNAIRTGTTLAEGRSIIDILEDIFNYGKRKRK